MELHEALERFLTRLGDNTLILGHRVSEWCGHAPVLEEDIALANTALDLIGQTQLWLGLAGEVQGEGKSVSRFVSTSTTPTRLFRVRTTAKGDQ